MGYFKRQVRRASARQTIRRTLFDTRLCGAGSDAARFPQRPRLYLRFSAGEMHPDSFKQKGIFNASNALHEHGRLSDGAWQVLEESRDWFNRNLIVPRLSERRAIFWFRADASDC